MEASTWYTSDLHIGGEFATRIRKMGSTQAHDARIAGWWDNNVKPNDHVIIIGDFTELEIAQPALEWLDERPGQKTLVAGNWDVPHLKDEGLFDWQEHFKEVLYSFVGWPLTATQRITLNHYPYDHKGHPGGDGWPGGFWPREVLLHGHTHSKKKVSRSKDGTLMIHVGWDAWHRFLTTQEIEEIITEERIRP